MLLGILVMVFVEAHYEITAVKSPGKIVLLLYCSPSGNVNNFLWPIDNILAAIEEIYRIIVVIGDNYKDMLSDSCVSSNLAYTIACYGWKILLKCQPTRTTVPRETLAICVLRISLPMS